MHTYSETKVHQMLNALDTSDYEFDNQGQIVIYTGIFQWEDGSFHDEADPKKE